MAAIGEVAADAERRISLTETVPELQQRHGIRMGPLEPRDFALLIRTQDELPEATEGEIADVPGTLASPLIGMLVRVDSDHVRFRVAGDSRGTLEIASRPHRWC
jgi:hypothetical protein